MREEPLVSVVTIFLDAGRFLPEAIESVIAQTYRRWELLLVDDGSTDAGTAVARRYAAAWPGRIRYLEHAGHANLGMSASRNAGVRHAAGACVAFLDADDAWFPEKLARQVAMLEAHPAAGLVTGAVEYWRSWTGGPEDAGQDVVLPVGAPANAVVSPPSMLELVYPLGSGTAPCPSDLLARRDLLEAVGGFEEHFRGPYQMYEDQAFLAKVYLETPVYVSGACLSRYRQHPGSCVATVTGSGQYHRVRRYFLEWFEGYLEARGHAGGDVWRRVQRALWPYRHPMLRRVGEAVHRAGREGRAAAGRLVRAARRS